MNSLGCVATEGAGRFSGVPVLGAVVEREREAHHLGFLPHLGQDILPPGRDIATFGATSPLWS